MRDHEKQEDVFLNGFYDYLGDGVAGHEGHERFRMRQCTQVRDAAGSTAHQASTKIGLGII